MTYKFSINKKVFFVVIGALIILTILMSRSYLKEYRISNLLQEKTWFIDEIVVQKKKYSSSDLFRTNWVEFKINNDVKLPLFIDDQLNGSGSELYKLIPPAIFENKSFKLILLDSGRTFLSDVYFVSIKSNSKLVLSSGDKIIIMSSNN